MAHQVQCLVVRASLLLLFLAAQLWAAPLGGKLDPAFDKVPFDQWLSEGKGVRFHWSVKTPRARLSFFQRLVTSVDIELDGRDLQTRRGDGELVFFVQITDSSGARYQDHDAVKLDKLSEDIRNANLEYAERIFVLPGEYKLSVAVLDTATGEHSAIRTTFRIPDPASFFFLDAWRGLPTVEFVGVQESPDSWYLPNATGQLQWAASVQKPVRLNILMNVASSAIGHETPSAVLAALFPTLKALTQTGAISITEHVKLLDLSRKMAAYQQDETSELDWPGVKSALRKANTASIDVHSLSERGDAQFFVSQVRAMLAGSSGRCVLVVLTGPMIFQKSEDLTPISTEAHKAPDAGRQTVKEPAGSSGGALDSGPVVRGSSDPLPPCRIYYVRYDALAFGDHSFGSSSQRNRHMRMGEPSPIPGPRSPFIDQLAGTLKPLNPRVFDIASPEQMTRVFAEIRQALLEETDGTRAR